MKTWWSSLRVFFWVVVGAVGVMVVFFGRAFLLKHPNPLSDGLLPDPPKSIMDAKAKAEEDALVARAMTKAKTTEKQDQLAAITNMDDGVERRKRLADFLKQV